uniref:Zinc finger protein 583 n=1 Tax=Molossus molossus TaxID=27622 RepID=A0A7J8CCV1_MOLMO|nr:zinc finger protein 583 [Molossus molossus]
MGAGLVARGGVARVNGHPAGQAKPYSMVLVLSRAPDKTCHIFYASGHRISSSTKEHSLRFMRKPLYYFVKTPSFKHTNANPHHPPKEFVYCFKRYLKQTLKNTDLTLNKHLESGTMLSTSYTMTSKIS